MKNNLLPLTGRWLAGCLLASILGFFLGLSQDNGFGSMPPASSRIQWPNSAWANR